MRKSVLLVSLIVVVVIVLGIVAWWFMRDGGSNGPGGNNSNTGAAVDPNSSLTREEVPAGITVPDAGSSASADVAVPNSVATAAPGVESKKRSFKINIEDDEFKPSTVIINLGDIANINFTAVDKSYDIVQPDYGFRLTIQEGQTRLLEGQFANPGKYLFYCESCGGLEGDTKGYIIVVPK